MRLFFGIAVGLGTSLIVGAFIACAPSSFDHITGVVIDAGVDSSITPLKEDATLVAPRAIAPLSGTFFNGRRPTLRWELVGPAIGARITLCGDPKCEGPRKKSFAANGRELTVPEDLEPGLWFWRLTSTTAESFGTALSQTFSLVVRGGTPGGTPVGSILDTNGDGKVDLLVSVEVTEGGISDRFGVLLLGTDIEDPAAISKEPPQAAPFDLVSPSAIFAATDLDGDGFSDMILATESILSGSPTPVPYIDVATGAATDVGYDTKYRLPRPALPAFDAVPFIRTPGDLDRDGYGDLVIGTKQGILASYGGTQGIAVFSFLDQIVANPGPDAGVLPPPASPIAISGYDIAEDGRSGVVFGSFLVGPPFVRTHTERDRVYDDDSTLLVDTPPPTPATNFAAGDLDGDGKTDLVFLTTVAGKPSICLFAGSEIPLTAKIACWTPATVPPGFAENMAVADLDGDGKDEVIVSATTGGVDVLSVPAPRQLVQEHLAIDYGTRLTVMNPGRPKPAVWAASRSDGASLAIFRGKERVRVIDQLAIFGATTPSKFGVPIR